MNRRLIPNTIIPSDLYVDRVADHQLREIINDMGRPGYVLVARQMGKTNLLINAKRKLETENDVFVYIDLSNRFDTEEECFRNIIDTILETNSEKLHRVASEIIFSRENVKATPHKEHSRELRKILSEISGKLIIILDEVDSLTSAKYSDKIFAHVRSIYFERINYPEYERLSYIISGVAEPSEIIKDKSISPFNIGQKILLGDFSREEYEGFIEKASLNFNNEATNKIFYWANGNPRLTWEICSEIEARAINGLAVNESLVDAVVNDLYLAKYDRPPIDHIRDLIESDAELRSAIVAIYYNKSETLSENVKSRLYLSGVIGSDYEFGSVRIKNKIVERSLSLEWITELDKKEVPTITKADNVFREGDYAKAAQLYNQIMSVDGVHEMERLHANYRIGASYFNLGEYDKVLLSYEKNLYSKDGYKEIYCEQLYLKGVSYLQISDYDNAIKCFEEIIADEVRPYLYVSLVNISSALIKQNECNENVTKAKEFLNRVIQASEDGESVDEQALAGAYYNLASLAEDLEKSQIFDLYMGSYKVAINNQRLSPLIGALRVADAEKSELVWKSIVDVIKSGDVKLDEITYQSGLELTEGRLSELLSIGIKQENEEYLDLVFSAFFEHAFKDKYNYSKFFLDLGITAFNSGRHNEAEYLFNKLLRLERNMISAECVFLANKFISCTNSNNKEALESYFKGFSNYIEDADVVDVILFENKIFSLFQAGDLAKGRKYCDLILNLNSIVDDQARIKYLTIFYLKMRCLEGQAEEFSQAKLVIDILDNLKEGDLKRPIDKNTLSAMRTLARKALAIHTKVVQFRNNGPQYGRNEIIKVKFEDGSIVRKKYKHLKDSLLLGDCEIIEN